LKRILIIGAGIFGTHIAIELAKRGVDVCLVDYEKEIIGGTSANSIMRVHSGLHYPRDFDTALQSRQGQIPFNNYYRDCIRDDFDNFYGLSKNSSRSGKSQIIKMAETAGIDVVEVSPSDLVETGLACDLLETAWRVAEGVVDVPKLRDFYHFEIQSSEVELMLAQRIVEITFQNKTWGVRSDQGFLGNFSHVVRATHGRNSIESNVSAITNQIFEYHWTSMLEISSKATSFGMTVLDGDFISLLPAGNGNNFFVYGPGVSILEKHTGQRQPENWKKISFEREANLISDSENLLRYWFPNFPDYLSVGARTTVRSVQAGVSQTDRRVTQVSEIFPSFIDVHSTKIDHVIEACDDVVRLLELK